MSGGDRPEPTPDAEIEDIQTRMSDSEDLERPKVEFEVGETVKINHGAFEGNNGMVEEIDPDKGRLKVTVNIFGRDTPVDVEYWEVDKGLSMALGQAINFRNKNDGKENFRLH